jgi:galactokinase/mevalonate kinase-like predicted kinase
MSIKKNKDDKRSRADLIIEYRNLDRLLSKVMRKKNKERGVLHKHRLQRKINNIKKNLTSIKKKIRSADRENEFGLITNRDSFSSRQISLKSAGSNKVNPDGILFLSKSSDLNSNKVMNRTSWKIHFDGTLLLSKPISNPMVADIYGLTVPSGTHGGE